MALVWNTALDMGADGVRMAIRGEGVVYNQSALAAWRPGKKEYVALGDEALALRGREPVGVRVASAVRGGRVAEEALLDMWIPFLLDEAQRIGGRGTLLLVGSPNACEADLQAVRAAAMRVGAPEVSVLQGALASALGAWFPQDAGTEKGAQVDVCEDSAVMVIEIGARQAYAALISGGRILRSESLPYGMHSATESVRRALRTEYGLAAGENTSEALLRTIGELDVNRETPPCQIDGLNLRTGLPGSVLVRAQTVRAALQPYCEEIGRMTASVIAHAQPEVAADIQAHGAMLTGGGARFPAVQGAVERIAGVRTRVSADPELAAIRGAARVMAAPNHFGDLPLNVDTKAR